MTKHGLFLSIRQLIDLMNHFLIHYLSLIFQRLCCYALHLHESPGRDRHRRVSNPQSSIYKTDALPLSPCVLHFHVKEPIKSV